MESNARFQLKDCRVTRVKELEKVAFLTVLCQAGKWPSYFDVTVFIAPPDKLEEGQAWTISGELQMQKPKDGGPWKLQLIARKFEKGDNKKAPVPKRSEDRPKRAEQQPLTDDSEIPF